MILRALADLLVVGMAIDFRPKQPRGLALPSFRCRCRCQGLEPHLRAGPFASYPKGPGGPGVILKIPVVNETEVLPESPVVRVSHDSSTKQVQGLERLSGARGGPLGQEDGSESISDNQLGVERGRDLQKWTQQVKASGPV